MTADEALTKAEFLKEHPPAIYPPQIGVLDIIEALAAEVRRLRDGGWISVEERLPEDDGYFLVSRIENRHPTTRLFTCGIWDSRAAITHWMPLPEVPHG